MGESIHPHMGRTDLLPETRSTPFCNHTLHFGGLTMKNTKRIRIIGEDGENGTVQAERETERERGKTQLVTAWGLGKPHVHGRLTSRRGKPAFSQCTILKSTLPQQTLKTVGL